MTNISALVNQSIGSTPPIEGMFELYKTYAARSRSEQLRMKRELEYIKDKTLLDTRVLFSLVEAFRDNSTPIVGIAPYRATTLEYRIRSTQGQFLIDSEQFLAFNIPPGVEERREAKRRENIAKLDKLGRSMEAMVQTIWRETDFFAQIPPTPKSLLPWNPLTRKKLFVLFDADWVALPVDPYLLERVNGHQYRVVAHWDLTEKECEIMRLIAG